MLAQGLLDFQYESDSSSHGLTSLAGLPVYIDLIKASGLGAAIRWHVGAAGSQGWLDIQMVLAVIFLNLSGGDCVDDIEKLEGDSGFSAILRAIEHEFRPPDLIDFSMTPNRRLSAVRCQETEFRWC
jgi:hypothetical protein